MASIAELLGNAEPEKDTVDVLLHGELVTFEFAKIDGDRWAELAAKFPPRPGNPTDLRVGGYNIDLVVKEAAKINGARVDVDPHEKPSPQQWDAIFEKLDGHGVKEIRDVVWTLNEYGPAQRLEAAKKARSTGGNGTTSPSVSE
jgi:hypothetical protein